MRHKREDYPMRVKLLETALELYLVHGFTLTTNRMIAAKLDCSPGEITHFFGTKENILCEVVRMVLPFHQGTLAENKSDDIAPTVRYCLEIAVEIAMCEQNATVRDLYINAYTLPKTLEFIREFSYKKSISLFNEHLPEWTEQDFYETEALTMGIVYGSLMDRCNPRYNLKQKLGRVLDALLKMYMYSDEERKAAVDAVLKKDIETLAMDAEAKMRSMVEDSLRKSAS